MMSEKEILMLKTGTLQSRMRLIALLRVARDPKISFEQAMEWVKNTATHEDKEPTK